MSRPSHASRLAAAIALGFALGCVPSSTSPSSGGAKYDGVYDMSVTVPPQVQPTPIVLARFFFVTNGSISSSDNTLSGSVADNFGNVTFSGPCPVGNTGGATFTGILNAGNPKFGQGTWRCANGGASSSWRVYNGQ